MNISPWRPFRDLATLRDDMWRSFVPGYWESPRLDVYQTEAAVIVHADLPGLVAKDDVEIMATPDSLTIRGQVGRANEVAEQDYHRAERFYGSFSRSLSLPASVTPERATASYANGVLEIRLPKSAGQRDAGVKIDVQ